MRDDAVLGRALPLDRGLGPAASYNRLGPEYQTIHRRLLYYPAPFSIYTPQKTPLKIDNYLKNCKLYRGLFKVVQGSIYTYYILSNFSLRGLFLDSIVGGYVLTCLLLGIPVQGGFMLM